MACAFFQTDEGGWSYDIPTRSDDDVPDLERGEDDPADDAPDEVP